ncbi:hypothetical protein BGZ98_009663 [Dissophora globulifera]|nr:hypothetical protein BGZ98_009663 [Dissophora globulifera]
MVFMNGQKFACATCIKGHRSTTCNHGERPLHEIKKKGRPSTQCAHCKELRKAKHVNARCICGREEGSATVANGLKRAKSLSHDGRLSVPAAIGGDDLLRSASNQGRSPYDSADALSSSGASVVLKHLFSTSGAAACACYDGVVCANCQDRAGRALKSLPHATGAALKAYSSNRQRNAASMDLSKSDMLLFPRDSASPMPFPPHVHSSDGLSGQGVNGTGLLTNGTPPLLVQTLSPSGNSGCDHSPSSSTAGHASQLQSQLCFDYASSSDYDSDHYNPTTSYSYFPESMASYPVSNASDDMEDMDLLTAADSKKIMDGIMNGTTTLNPMESASADEIRMLYSALSTFSTASPPAVPTPPSRSYSSPGLTANSNGPSAQSLSMASSTKQGCCSSGKTADAASPASSIPSHSPSAGRSEFGEDESALRADGCGCALSPNMCCCGERCACPGCLAFPNNRGLSNGKHSEQEIATTGPNRNEDLSLMDNAHSTNLSTQSLNLSAALSLIQNGGDQANSGSLDLDAREALKQEFMDIGLPGFESAQTQHPTLLGDNGVLICGCGCGRPTVDCAECFRDMCHFVGGYQAKVMKGDFDFENVLRGESQPSAPDFLGLNMNMAMDMTMNNLDSSDFGDAPIIPPTMSLLMVHSNRSDSGSAASPSAEQQQQQQQQQMQQQQQQLQQQQQQRQMQLAQQMQQRNLLRRRFRDIDEDQKLQMQLMEQEQMQLQQMQQTMPNLNQMQLGFLDDEDWSFVDEIRDNVSADTDMNGVQRS